MKFLEKIDMNEFSVAIPAVLNNPLIKHLIRSDGQEDVAFALYNPSIGKNRYTSLIHEIILPGKDERILNGDSVEITSAYFKRVCKIAVEKKSGVILLHSHPLAGWQGMSKNDIKTEESYAPSCLTLTDLPFVGLTLSSDKVWSGRVWEFNDEKHVRKSAATVRIVGKKLNVSYDDVLRPKPEFKNSFRRTVTVWGQENHNHLARLRVGIIGLGSVGSIVCESLARMGVERFVIMDFDEVQEHNLDRLLGATFKDIGQPKVNITHRLLEKASTAASIQINDVQWGITEEEGYKNALDCDVLFSCVDRPWPRYVLNHLAYNHLIPVIDGGIQVRFDVNSREFEGADWQLQTVGPERVCLRCLNAYNPADVSTEQEGLLEDPSYLAGLPPDHAFKRNENIFPFSTSLASLETMQFIEMMTGIGGTHYFGPQRYVYNAGYIRLFEARKCEQECLFTKGIAMGDTLFPPPYGNDHSANAARKRQASS